MEVARCVGAMAIARHRTAADRFEAVGVIVRLPMAADRFVGVAVILVADPLAEGCAEGVVGPVEAACAAADRRVAVEAGPGAEAGDASRILRVGLASSAPWRPGPFLGRHFS
jgi:hypothetical protein